MPSFTSLTGVHLSTRGRSCLYDVRADGPSRQLRLLIDSVRDHALYLLDPEGIVCSWNPGAERIKGYSADEVVGTHFGRFYLATERGRRTAAPAPPRGAGAMLPARAGGYAATAPRSAPAWSSSRSLKRANCLASSRSPATSPSNGRHSDCCAMPSVRCATPAVRDGRPAQPRPVARVQQPADHHRHALDLLSLRVRGDDARAAELLDAAQAATTGALLTRQLLAFSTARP